MPILEWYSLLDNGIAAPELEQKRMSMCSGFSSTASPFASFPPHILCSTPAALLPAVRTPHSVSCPLVFTHVGDSWPFLMPADPSGHCLLLFLESMSFLPCCLPLWGVSCTSSTAATIPLFVSGYLPPWNRDNVCPSSHWKLSSYTATGTYQGLNNYLLDEPKYYTLINWEQLFVLLNHIFSPTWRVRFLKSLS